MQPARGDPGPGPGGPRASVTTPSQGRFGKCQLQFPLHWPTVFPSRDTQQRRTLSSQGQPIELALRGGGNAGAVREALPGFLDSQRPRPGCHWGMQHSTAMAHVYR